MIALARIIAHAWLMPAVPWKYAASWCGRPVEVRSQLVRPGRPEGLGACPQRGGSATATSVYGSRRAGA